MSDSERRTKKPKPEACRHETWVDVGKVDLGKNLGKRMLQRCARCGTLRALNPDE